jgi:hypothetical protein
MDTYLDALRLALGVLIGAGTVLLIMLVTAPRSAPVQLDQNHMVFNPHVRLDSSQVQDYRPEFARPCSSDCGVDD